MSPPVPTEELAGALAAFGAAARTLPAVAYTSREVLAWELRRLFAGAWTCVGRSDELFPAGVTQRAVTAGDVGVLLTNTDGRARGFGNVCRHRGHELLPIGGTGTARAVVCPYHGWSYRLDGALAAAPRMPTDLVAADHGLVEVPVGTWQGWLFVNALGGAPPLPGYLGGLADLIAPYHPATLTRGARHRYEVAANWKVVVENYHECYHCPLIHPELCKVSPPASGANWEPDGAWVGGAMDLREHAETMSLDGRSGGAFIPGAERRRVHYLGLVPDLLISLHPDYVMTHRLRPDAPDRTRVECSWYVPEGVADAGYAVEFWDRTNRQDWTACESVQRGVASPHFRPGPFAPNEDAVHAWVRLVALAYRGGAAAAP
jgi:Rieske 2Fe-2S family protein